MTARRGIIDRLSGGDPRSLGATDAVAAEVVEDRERGRVRSTEELWEAVAHPDPLVRSRAVDALEKVTRSHPESLDGHGDEVVESLAIDEAAEIRWHAAAMIPRLALGADRWPDLVRLLEQLMTDRSAICRAVALDALVQLADRDPSLTDRADEALSAAFASDSPAVRARARRLVAARARR